MVYSTDKPHQTGFSYSTENNNFSTCVPDFTFDKWTGVGIADYDRCVDEIIRSGNKIPQINKVGWIGNINTNFRRKKLYEVGNKNTEILDIFDCGNWWKNPNSVKLNSKMYISTPELVKKYSILIHFSTN